jgi:hypothetical protein
MKRIGKNGWLAMVGSRFGGDADAARRWFVGAGLFSQDVRTVGGRLVNGAMVDPDRAYLDYLRREPESEAERFGRTLATIRLIDIGD